MKQSNTKYRLFYREDNWPGLLKTLNVTKSKRKKDRFIVEPKITQKQNAIYEILIALWNENEASIKVTSGIIWKVNDKEFLLIFLDVQIIYRGNPYF